MLIIQNLLVKPSHLVHSIAYISKQGDQFTGNPKIDFSKNTAVTELTLKLLYVL